MLDVANHPNRSRTLPDAYKPTPAEVRQTREREGLTQAGAGALVHASWQTWQNWELEGEEGRRMHPATWELFKAKVRARQMLERGTITADQLAALGLHLPPTPDKTK